MSQMAGNHAVTSATPTSPPGADRERLLWSQNGREYCFNLSVPYFAVLSRPTPHAKRYRILGACLTTRSVSKGLRILCLKKCTTAPPPPPPPTNQWTEAARKPNIYDTGPILNLHRVVSFVLGWHRKRVTVLGRFRHVTVVSTLLT